MDPVILQTLLASPGTRLLWKTSWEILEKVRQAAVKMGASNPCLDFYVRIFIEKKKKTWFSLKLACFNFTFKFKRAKAEVACVFWGLRSVVSRVGQ